MDSCLFLILSVIVNLPLPCFSIGGVTISTCTDSEFWGNCNSEERFCVCHQKKWHSTSITELQHKDIFSFSNICHCGNTVETTKCTNITLYDYIRTSVISRNGINPAEESECQEILLEDLRTTNSLQSTITTGTSETTVITSMGVSDATTKETTKTPEVTTIETTKTPEVTTIETTKTPEVTTIETTKPPEVTTIETTKTPEVTTIETTKTPELTTIETTKTSELTTIETTKTPELTTIETTKTPELTTIETTKTPELTTIETTKTPELTTIETTKTPDLTTIETTKTPELTTIETTKTPKVTTIETTETPELTTIRASLTPDASTTGTFLNNGESCPCSCDYFDKVNYWSNQSNLLEQFKDLEIKLTEIRKQLTVNFRNLSSSVRTRVSAPDERQSSAVIGSLGIIFISLVFGGIFLSDFPIFVQHTKTILHKLKRYFNTFQD